MRGPLLPVSSPLLHFTRINLHHCLQEFNRVLTGPLEGIAPDNRPKPSAVTNGARLVEHVLVAVLLRAAGKDHNAAPVKRALHHVSHALCQSANGHCGLGVRLLSFNLLNVVAGQLYLHNVRAKLSGNVGGVRNHVDGRFTFFAKAGSAGEIPST